MPGVLYCLALALLTLCQPGLAQPRIAIIIDDLGYHRQRGEAIIKLPAAVTCAVIPFSPHSRHLAERASQAGKEVIVHMPMAAQHQARLDRGGLQLDMQEEDIASAVRDALGHLPQARGLNNHMGSALTERPEAMGWLMNELKTHQLFFVDSRTSSRSVARQTAQRVGIASARRDIFLDNDRKLASINRQFNKLLALARQRGQAIAIGHPHPETVHYLQQALPLLHQAGIQLVPVSALLDTPAEHTVSTGEGGNDQAES